MRKTAAEHDVPLFNMPSAETMLPDRPGLTLRGRPRRTRIPSTMWRVLALIAMAGVWLTPRLGVAADKPVVAVFNLENKGARLKKSVLENLSDYLATRLSASGKYKVVPRQQVQQALQQQKSTSYKACYDESCQIELGKELAAEKTLASQVSRIGKKCIVTMKLYDLRSSTTEVAGYGDGPCSEDGVLESINTALATVTGGAGSTSSTEESPAATVPPGGGYGDLDADAAKADKEAKRNAKDRVRREKAAKRDWKKVRPYAENKRIKRKKRIAVLEKFLANFKKDNPHRGEAEAAIERLEAGDYVFVPGGKTFIGCNKRVDRDCYPDEKPGRKVRVGAFYIERTEVTVAAFRECVQAGACSGAKLDIDTYANGAENTAGNWACNWNKRGHENHPINCVVWAEADKYCRWKGGRLPTDNEWERAARGSDGRKYPWGNRRGRAKASMSGNADGFKGTAPVGTFPGGASPFGALDMAGNVSEWTADWYVGLDKPKKVSRKSRSTRSGSFGMSLGSIRTSMRQAVAATSGSCEVGFRCARSE